MEYRLPVLALIGMAVCASAHAEPVTAPLRVLAVRPYHDTSENGNGGEVFITVDQTSHCNTNIYRIPLKWHGSKESVAVAMAALLSEKLVQIEIDNAGCGTPAWRTNVQSIYLLN